ncbi:PTS system mannose/fructose/sorbose family transporter subunit IID [Lacrimispora saccharolytica]|uniref:PTS system mannose/fructose/sorbose family IID component n=1 Tax=Lacrimispora saccharolytica (strain ATCC 35040 / DSM 2544 / NRCC 2533 / WM1) TaxID=610130 RepID=D9R3P9_LACSW|nr:PTS system mannose/fructose/sorbose family transporter subunit IID [Lacrimispora saccharolytica]ADL06770.1 PTS system mannose/fructose/sorbose family IID component [[Clostridium] saccharolyticum WM1]QRV19163.1 PTS system mannose/fructose/sorbose family transporter subunit IID [Lacrimispora saccharolytica]
MGNNENRAKDDGIMSAKDYRSIFWRSFTIQSSWSFDKMMAYGYMYAIERPLRKIYPNDDDFYAALKRHTETFNLTPHVSPFVMSLGVAMEEQNAKSEEFETDSINNVKVGLMGPLSGIGDSFFWGTFRVITAGIGIGIAQSGNILGAIIYFLLYTAIHFVTKILAGKYGYKLGTSFLENTSENHTMEKLSYGASILGMTVIGAMIATMVSLQTTLSFTLAEAETTLQSIFDQIFPGLLPLGVTFLCVWLYHKNVKTIYIILGIFVGCILGCSIGIF